MYKYCLLVVTLVMPCLLQQSIANAVSNERLLQQYRRQFQRAEYALNNRRYQQAGRLIKILKDYPLYPYLIYKQLSINFDSVSYQQIKNFLTQYASSPLANRLRKKWLLALAKKHQWRSFLISYVPSDDISLQCYYNRALYRTAHASTAMANTPAIWLSATSLPKACDPLFRAWYQRGGPSTKLVWQRITMAITHRELELAKYLGRFLTSDDKKILAVWLQLDRRPQLLCKGVAAGQTHAMYSNIIKHGIKRFIKTNDQQLIQLWDQLVADYQLTDTMQGELLQELALELAASHRSNAAPWLAKVPPEFSNTNIRQWRIRTALLHQNWPQALHWLNTLPLAEQQDDSWRYWQARALDKLANNNTDSARVLYENLASKRNYYGMLASKQIDQEYILANQTYQVNQRALATVKNIVGIKRAKELYILQRFGDARREWWQATAPLSLEQRKAAAVLAQQWSWHDQAINTAKQAQLDDDLLLRFPLANQEFILLAAKQNNIDPALTFAIARQESSFTSDARSSVGALGIMQIMPDTALDIAKERKLVLKSMRELLKPEININLGTAYLRKAYNRYHNNPVLAAAAYNAGPYRVSRWLPQKQDLAADLWIETIPYSETRNYIKNVLTYAVIYEQNLGKIPDITKHMHIINQDVG